MSTNKVAWLESQYLYQHHFQQQDRYVESLVEQRARAIRPFVYGFAQYGINQAKLNEGVIALDDARGVMLDGCPFDIKSTSLAPVPIKVPEHVKNQRLYLAIPNFQPGYQYLTTDAATQDLGRYVLEEVDAYDYSTTTLESEKIATGRLQLQFLYESDELGGFTCLPLARISEVTAEGAVLLDTGFIPPVLNIHANANLASFLDTVIGLLQQRGSALAGRLNQSGSSGGGSTILDFMLLQVTNRYESLLRHLAEQKQHFHPERLFSEFRALLGDLASFTTADKRWSSYPSYLHQDLEQSFMPLVGAIQRCLSAVLEQTAMSLPVEKRQYGIFVSPINDRSMLSSASFVLAIKAKVPTNDLRGYLPDHIKVGSVDTIRDLVNNQLTGIGLTPLPMAPREISYQAGFVYFELNTDSEIWQNLTKSAGFAFHIAGELPELAVEFWAVRH